MKKPLSLLFCVAFTFVFAAVMKADVATAATEADYNARYGGSHARAELETLLRSDTVSAKEKDALRFLYAYLPLPDVADYTPQFYLENIRATYRAMERMPWGNIVPDREFRHFVLPVRVNNENLDMSRPVMFAELEERVKGLTMEEAILEVNHWCHEKATYRPSDPRTNSPLATMRAALGRCGEESTFTVAALRSVGIPARQVYTPRWAHTDDNHAWVEAWANGRWHFLGACEPEAVLDLGWFNAPASRGMLMTTKVFGRYDGPEEVLQAHRLNTVINVTKNYAPVKEIGVRVVDKAGNPVQDATVNFSLYNYAEFYPVAVKKTDARGEATLLAGCGDMVAWASDGASFGLAKVDAGDVSVIRLDKHAGDRFSAEFDIVPPPPSAKLPEVTAEQAAVNDRRKAQEDSIRMAYTATFCTQSQAEALASRLALPAGDVAKVMSAARGNHAVIERFLTDAAPAHRAKALTLLMQLEEKDLNDVTLDVLADHLSTPDDGSPLFTRYVFNPRVDTEMLTPYKQFFAEAIGEVGCRAYKADPAKWGAWVASNIAAAGDDNPLGLRMSPQGVWRERRADALSRSIFFVAGARSMGIPARIDPVSGKTQYADSDGRWIDVDFGAATAVVPPQGNVRLNDVTQGSCTAPKYYYQFTLSKLDGGLPVLQNYPDDASVADFAEPVATDEGGYMLLTGQRMADGSVLAKAEFFPVRQGALTEVPLEVRRDSTGVQVIGTFNSENIYHDAVSATDKSLLSTTGRGYYVLGLIQPGHEPSAHALNDISAVGKEFERWGKSVVLLLPDGDGLQRFDATLFPDLPSNVVLGSDPQGRMANEIVQSLNLPSADDRPIFIIADTFNRIVYVQQGYTIGLGEKLLDVIHKLAE